MVRGRALLVVAVTTACGRISFDSRNDARGGDAAACANANPFFDACNPPTGTTTHSLSGPHFYDTDAGTLRDMMNNVLPHTTIVDVTRDPPLRVAAFGEFVVAGAGGLTVTGSLPLVIVANQRIEVSGMLMAWATPSGDGPGASSCAPATGDGAPAFGGGGGGGGGGLGGSGGSGGAGDTDDDTLPAGPTMGGTGGPAFLPPSLRGGCRGGNGGDGKDPGAAGGFAGGGVLLARGGHPDRTSSRPAMAAAADFTS